MVRYSRITMHVLFSRLLDYIFPPSEDTLRVRALTEDTVRSLYRQNLVDETYVLAPYSNKNIRALIHEAKFHGNKKAFTLLSMLISSFLASNTKPIDVLIPMPISRARMRARGFNQVLEVLRMHTVSDRYTIETDALVRTRDTRPQTELTREERLQNLKDAFSVLHPERIAGKHILLIDDVTTTGVTLRTAKATLLPYSPASVTCVAFAH